VTLQATIALPLTYPLSFEDKEIRHVIRINATSTEEQLIAGTLDGNEDAFRLIVERYIDEVSRTVTGMLGAGLEIDDVVQEVFIKLHRSLHTFRGESTLKTFVVRIAINKSLDALRKRKRMRWLQPWSHEEPWEPDSGERSDQGITDSEDLLILRQAVDRLPENQRAVVVLRLIDQYSTEETARILNVPYGTVLSRLKRGVEKLKKDLRNTTGYHQTGGAS
jgi:RNA polymerase sigma-70 factor (ECF subfamily)